jgi:hypothetical protein
MRAGAVTCRLGRPGPPASLSSAVIAIYETMAPTRAKSVLPEARELDGLADALEKQSAAWGDYDISERPQYPTRAYRLQEDEKRRRAGVLWDTAIAAGAILVRLSERAALDQAPRIKNAVEQLRAEMAKSRREGKAPISYFVVNVLYDPHREDSYDVFMVKLFEALCKIFATSLDDRRGFETYYARPKDKAAFHVRMLRAFSKWIRESGEMTNS